MGGSALFVSPPRITRVATEGPHAACLSDELYVSKVFLIMHHDRLHATVLDIVVNHVAGMKAVRPNAREAVRFTFAQDR